MYRSIYIIGHFEMAAAIERTSEASSTRRAGYRSSQFWPPRGFRWIHASIFFTPLLEQAAGAARSLVSAVNSVR